MHDTFIRSLNENDSNSLIRQYTYANNLPVCHSISSFDCTLEMACSISRGRTAFIRMKIIQRQTAASKIKKYYSLNLHTKYSSVNE